MPGSDSTYIDFSISARLMKFPSIRNARRAHEAPYTVQEGALGACLRAFVDKPEKTRHLYEIHTKAQPPLVTEIIANELAMELARLREFL